MTVAHENCACESCNSDRLAVGLAVATENLNKAAKKVTTAARFQRRVERQAGVYSRRFQTALHKWYGIIDTEYLRVMRFFHIEKGVTVLKVGVEDLIVDEFDWEYIDEEGEEIITEAESTMSRDAILAIIIFAALALYYDEEKEPHRPGTRAEGRTLRISRDSAIDRAIQVAQVRAGALITGITDTMRQNIHNSVVFAIRNNYSINMLARMIRPGLPALPASVNRINRQFAEMIARGASVPKAMAWAQREFSKASDYRAKMIARTEASAALNDGALLMYREAGITMVEYIAQPTACDICAPYDGDILSIDEATHLIPQHQNCVCSFYPVT